MYDHREMKYEQKIRDITFAGDGEDFFGNFLRQRQMFFLAMRYRAAALFPLFLHGKERLFYFPLRNLDFEKLLGHNFLDFDLFFLDFD